MKTILIIDDNEHLLKLLSKFLSRSGFRVYRAVNGNAGLKAFSACRPDIVITDIIMPDKEGLETIIELRKHAPTVKIIAISGGGKIGPQTYLPMAKLLGADCILEKPFRLLELLAHVKELVAGERSYPYCREVLPAGEAL